MVIQDKGQHVPVLKLLEATFIELCFVKSCAIAVAYAPFPFL